MEVGTRVRLVAEPALTGTVVRTQARGYAAQRVTVTVEWDYVPRHSDGSRRSRVHESELETTTKPGGRPR